MYVENITSDAMVLDNNGKAMQIKVYEDLLKEKGKEIERLKEELKYTIPIVEHNKTITKHLKEIERLNNIIYTTLEYVDREEINSTGKPYIYTERGKHIKELLEGERTFNSLWQENNRLNNIINELERKMLNDKLYVEDISKKQPYPIEEFRIRNPYTTGSYDTCINYLDKLQELKGVDKE